MAKKQLKLHIDDESLIVFSEGDGIVIKHTSGAKITVDSSGIVLDNGSGSKIELKSAGVTIKGTTVDINDGALKVM